jgi:hypothetical protein
VPRSTPFGTCAAYQRGQSMSHLVYRARPPAEYEFRRRLRPCQYRVSRRVRTILLRRRSRSGRCCRYGSANFTRRQRLEQPYRQRTRSRTQHRPNHPKTHLVVQPKSTLKFPGCGNSSPKVSVTSATVSCLCVKLLCFPSSYRYPFPVQSMSAENSSGSAYDGNTRVSRGIESTWAPSKSRSPHCPSWSQSLPAP